MHGLLRDPSPDPLAGELAAAVEDRDALLLGALLAGVVLPIVGLRGLAAEVHAPEEVEQGTEAFVDVKVTNRSRGVRWGLRVLDDHLAPADVFLTSIRPKERVDVTTMRVPAALIFARFLA